MSFFTKVFWKTLWQDRKLSISLIGVIAAILLVYLIWRMLWFHFDRAWNWNLGGYESNTQEVVCEMIDHKYLSAEGLKICK